MTTSSILEKLDQKIKLHLLQELLEDWEEGLVLVLSKMEQIAVLAARNKDKLKETEEIIKI